MATAEQSSKPAGVRVTGTLQLTALFIAVAFLAAGAPVGAATTFTTLYEFQQVGSELGPDGYKPNGLIVDPSRSLYGTTMTGGGTTCPLSFKVMGCGTVIKLTPPPMLGGAWTESVLYRFSGGSDGSIPQDRLVLDAAGALYGTASQGGSPNPHCTEITPLLERFGCGTVFKMTPPTTAGGAWSESVLYTFAGDSDGAAPNGSMLFDGSGALYGTTGGGGNPSCNSGFGCGVVFKLMPPTTASGAWTETVLHTFTGADGETPNGGLIFDASGALYGTTQGSGAGCAGACGTVFKLTPPMNAGGAWGMTVLYTFTGGADGQTPNGGLIFDASGALYGTTQGSGAGCAGTCGTVFKLTPPINAGGAWGIALLYTFTGGADGAIPSAGLILDGAGALYGSAYSGGNCPVSGGCGTLFKLAPPTTAADSWTESTLHTFTDGSDGQGPLSVVFDASGALYGVAAGGGASSSACGGLGCGTVFELTGAGTPLSQNPQTADFHANGKSGILWQSTDGAVAIWEMNGTTIVGGSVIGNPGPSWHVIGTGNFYGSLYSDILWQNDNGSVAIWEMNGTTIVSGGVIGNPGTSWHAVATGDFYDRGYSDILWQNDNGAVAIWEMNGTTIVGGGVIGNPGTSWHVIGTGDFYDTGYSSILWQNTDGSVAIWQMNGTTIVGGAIVGNPGTSWHVIGTGDFWRDGYSGILWQNDDGAVAIWKMNGTTIVGGSVIGNPGPSWHVIGTGDFWGAGYSGILWRNIDGTPAIWQMNGTTETGGAVLSNPGTGWYAIGE
jgi:hypothetical protein